MGSGANKKRKSKIILAANNNIRPPRLFLAPAKMERVKERKRNIYSRPNRKRKRAKIIGRRYIYFSWPPLFSFHFWAKQNKGRNKRNKRPKIKEIQRRIFHSFS